MRATAFLTCTFTYFFVQVDFANQESQMAFYRSMQASGQDIRDFYDILSERRLVTLCLSNVYVNIIYLIPLFKPFFLNLILYFGDFLWQG